MLHRKTNKVSFVNVPVIHHKFLRMIYYSKLYMSHTSCLSILFIPVRQADETSGCCDCCSVKTRGEWLSERVDFPQHVNSTFLHLISSVIRYINSISSSPHFLGFSLFQFPSLNSILFWRLQRTVVHIIQSTQLNRFEGHRFHGVRINDGVRLRADKGKGVIEMYTSLLLYNMSHSVLYHPIYPIF